MLPYGSGIWGARGPESCDPAECSAESNIRKPKENHNRACEHSYCFRWRPSDCSEDVPGRKGNGTLKPKSVSGPRALPGLSIRSATCPMSATGSVFTAFGLPVLRPALLEKRAGATNWSWITCVPATSILRREASAGLGITIIRWRKIVPSNSAPIIPMPQPVPTEIVSWRRRRRGKLPRCISP